MRHLKVVLSLFLLSLFTAYQVSITMFTHTHYVNGVRITHSHPFAKGVEHTHTQAEIITIDRLAHYTTLEVESPRFICAHEIVFRSIEINPTLSTAHDSYQCAPSLRAPPAPLFT